MSDGNIVYLDRNQCIDFGVEYFGAGSLCVPADELLRSKDYDRIHRDLLEPLGQSLVHLERRRCDDPGWFGLFKTPSDSPAGAGK